MVLPRGGAVAIIGRLRAWGLRRATSAPGHLRAPSACFLAISKHLCGYIKDVPKGSSDVILRWPDSVFFAQLLSQSDEHLTDGQGLPAKLAR